MPPIVSSPQLTMPTSLPRKLFQATDKALIPTLPRYLYEGKIHVIIGESEAKSAVKALRSASILGLDTETRPTFHKGEQHKVALLQIASPDQCFLFRLCRMSGGKGLPDCLVSLLTDERPLKVGLSLHDDFLMLRRRRDFKPATYVELQTYAKEMGIEDMSLQKLYANVFRQRISKNARLSNWEADVLGESQQRYAATDAVACINLYLRLKELRSTADFEIVKNKQ